jgi:hypothetical protein
MQNAKVQPRKIKWSLSLWVRACVPFLVSLSLDKRNTQKGYIISTSLTPPSLLCNPSPFYYYFVYVICARWRIFLYIPAPFLCVFPISAQCHIVILFGYFSAVKTPLSVSLFRPSCRARFFVLFVFEQRCWRNKKPNCNFYFIFFVHALWQRMKNNEPPCPLTHRSATLFLLLPNL